MRFPTLLTFSCLLVVGTAVGHTQTAEQQEKALRSLRNYIAEQEGRSGAPATAKGATAEQTPSLTTEQESAARQSLEQLRTGSAPQDRSLAQATPSTLSEDNERKARQALDELRRSGGPSGPGATTSAAPPAGLSDAAEQKARAALVQNYNGTATSSTSAPISSDQETRARSALDRMRGAEGAPAAPVVATTGTQHTVATTSAASSDSTALPLVRPAGGSSRDAQLQEILDLYIADRISAREYHERRAKILSGN